MAILDNAIWLTKGNGTAENGSTVINDGGNSTTVFGTFTGDAWNATQNGYNVSDFGAFGRTSAMSANYRFSNAVENLSFDLQDVNSSGTSYDDKFTIYAYDENGDLLSADEVIRGISGLNGDTVSVNRDGSVSVEGDNGTANDVTFDLPGQISQLEIVYAPGKDAASTGGGGISDLRFDVAGPDAVKDFIVEGTERDDTIDGSYRGDPDGDLVDGNDHSDGSNNDSIRAGGGNDSIRSGAGNDTIDGGTGNDSIHGGGGRDSIDGGDGIDTIDGAGGADTINAGAGNDTILDSGGNDVIDGGDGKDRFDYQTIRGNDTVVGGETNDTSVFDSGDKLNAHDNADDLSVTFTGDEAGTMSDGNDTITFSEIEHIQTGMGSDTIDASASRVQQILDGGEGSDTLQGGSGDDIIAMGLTQDFSATDGDDDTLILEDGFGDDSIEGFEIPTDLGGGNYRGNDQLDVTGLRDAGGQPVNVDDVRITDTNGNGTGDAILQFPNGESITLWGVRTSEVSSDDQLIAMGIPAAAPALDYIVEGTGGDDTIVAGTYTDDPNGDMVDANDHSDGSNDDSIEAGAGDDSIVAGAGDDTILGESGNDTINGGAGSDSIVGGTGDDSILGGAGADIIRGDTGSDTLDYSASSAGVTVDLGDQSTNDIGGGITAAVGAGGDAQGDIIRGMDNLVGSSSNDTLTLHDGAESRSADGGAGDDAITGGSGANTLTGGAGDDTLDGAAGADSMAGGDGDDTFILEDRFGSDTIIGGETGETDGDTLDLTGVTSGVTLDLTDANAETGTVSDISGTATFQEIENITLSAGRDRVVLADGGGDDTVSAFDLTDSGDGSTNDQLNVSGLTSDGGTTPVNTGDVTVGDDGAGNAVLSFPGGESITLIGVAPGDVDSASELEAIGIPAAAAAPGTATIHDAIQLGGAVPTSAATLVTANGDLVDVEDAITFSLADDNAIQAGDTTTIGGVAYTVTEIRSIEANITHDGGATTTPTKVQSIELVDGDGAKLGFLVPMDSMGAREDITQISILSSDPETNIDVIDVDGDDTVTLEAPPLNFIVEGTAGDDTIDAGYVGDPEGDRIDNLDHSDGSNDDSVEAYGGNDYIESGLGNDTVWAGTGDDTVYGGAGDDFIRGQGGADSLFGEAGADSILGNTGADFIDGGIGNDTINSDGGADTIFGGAGADDIRAGSDHDRVDGGGDNDTIRAGSGNDTVEGGGGDDTIVGQSGDDLVFGGDGLDTILGGTGADTVYGGAGNDSITLGADDDVSFGGGGDDTINGNAGDDQIFGDEPLSVTIGPGGAQGQGTGGAEIAGLTDMPTDNLTFEMQYEGDAMGTPGPDDPALSATLFSYGTAGSPEELSVYAVSDNEVYDLSTPGDLTDTVIETGYVTVDVNGVTYTTGITSNSVIDGGAHSMAVTFDATAQELVIFFDGAPVETIALINDTALESGGTLSLGQSQSTQGGFSGEITEARLWSDIRSDAEINQFDDTPLGDEAGDPNLISNWMPDPFTGGLRDDIGDNSMAPTGDVRVNTAPGGGDDVIFGGDGSDTIMGSDGNDTLDGDNAAITGGADYIDGGAGDDQIIGDVGDDILRGGAGNDTIFGGVGADAIRGGSGADEIYGQEGNDTIDASGTDGFGDSVDAGDDRDYIYAGAGDTVSGGAGGDDFDTLDLNGSVSAGGSKSVTITGADSNGNGVDGFVDYFDDLGGFEGRLEFSEIESIICFTTGTRIMTQYGDRPIETLKVGDMVVTRDNGLQPIRWIGSRSVVGRGSLAPISISPEVLDGAERRLLVSPQHRMLFTGYKAELLFGESEVLIAAKHLVNGADIHEAPCDAVTYVHLMLNAHEVIYAEGTATESFHAGETGLAAVTDQGREEMFSIFPELRWNTGAHGATARSCLKKHEARMLLH